MKKIIHVIFFILLCPIMMGAVSQSGNVQTDPNQNRVAPTDQTLNLTSDMFGLHGPLSVGMQYSADYGYILQGKFTQLLLRSNAISLGLEGGSNERRASVTFAQALTTKQRIKLTAEYFAQNMDFNFASGKSTQWVSQPAYGMTYEYLLNSLLQDINLNATYSHAQSKTLANRNYTNTTGTWTNYRHIAGATDKSVSAGVDVLPFKTTLVGAQLNYDNVKYNTRYADNDAKNTSGLGATITLDQLINKHLKLELLGSHRETYQDYKAGVSWLLHTKPGTQLELQLAADRLINKAGQPNDTRTGLTLSYSWGGDSHGSSAEYNLSTSNSTNDLAAWASEPAVHMEQVLAVRDEKSVQVSNSLNTQSTNSNAVQVVTVYVGEPVDIHVDQYFSTMASNNAKVNYAVNHLPSQLNFKPNEITGEFDQATEIGDYSVNIEQDITKAAATNDKTTTVPTSVVVPLVIRVAAAPSVPVPNKNFNPGTLSGTIGQPFSFETRAFDDGSVVKSDFMFINAEYYVLLGNNTCNQDTINSTLPSAGGLQGTGLKAGYIQIDKYDARKDKFTISGTPTQSGTYNVVVKAHNIRGWSTGSQIITIVIGEVGTPTVTVHQNDHFTVGDTADYNLADLTANTGNLDLSSATVSGDTHGMTVTKVGEGQATGNLTLVMPAGTGLASPTFSEETLTITGVKNTAGKTASDQTFKLNIAGSPVPNDQQALATTITQGGSGNVDLSAQPYYKNPTKSGDISAYSNDTPAQTGITASVTGTTITVNVASDVPAGSYPINVYATNAIGKSIAKILTVTVSAAGTPTVTVHQNDHFTVGDTADYNLADLIANTGNLNLADATVTSSTGDMHGMTVTKVGEGQATGNLTLVMSAGTGLTSPTFVGDPPVTFTISHVKNTAGKEAADQTFTLDIAGAPVPNDQQALATTITQGESGSVDLSAQSYYKNPTKSGDISAYSNDTPAQTGITASVMGTTITINVASDVPAGDYPINVYATNTIGKSIAKILTVTVSAAGTPTVTVHQNDHFTVGDTADYNLADLIANTGNLNLADATVTSSTGDMHGMTVTKVGEGQATGNLTLVMPAGTGLTSPTFVGDPPVTFTISHVKNTAGKEAADQTFTLDIAGAPVPNDQQALATTITQGGSGNVDLSAQPYYKNPTKSGDISAYSNDTPAQTGITASVTGTTITINVASDVPAGDYPINVYATNTIGKSIAKILTVTVSAAGTPTFNPDPPTNPTYTQGETKEVQLTVASAGTSETFADENAIQINAVDTGGKLHPLSDFGLAKKIDFNGDKSQATISVTGTVAHADYSPQNYQIVATNTHGKSTTSQTFTLTVNASTPSFNPDPPSSATYTQGETKDVQLTVASAGAGSTFVDENAIQINAVDTGGKLHPLSDFGLAKKIDFNGDKSQATISVTGTAAHADYSPQNYQIVATNAQSGSATSQTFTLTVNASTSTAYLKCPVDFDSIVGGKGHATSTDSMGQSYGFENSAGIIAEGLSIKSLRYAQYYSDHSLKCDYILQNAQGQTMGEVALNNGTVPTSQYDSSTAKFTNVGGSICNATGQPDKSAQTEYCKLEYKKK